MILENGEKVLVVHRRLFAEDAPRYFLGVVDGYENGIAKVKGHTWVRDSLHGLVGRKEDPRTKVFSISSGMIFVYELPRELDLGLVKFHYEKDGRVVLCDGRHFQMDLGETEKLK